MNQCMVQKLQMRRMKGKTLLVPKFSQGTKELACESFNQEEAIRYLACAIIMHYPLSIADHVGFRILLTTLQSLY